MKERLLLVVVIFFLLFSTPVYAVDNSFATGTIMSLIYISAIFIAFYFYFDQKVDLTIYNFFDNPIKLVFLFFGLGMLFVILQVTAMICNIADATNVENLMVILSQAVMYFLFLFGMVVFLAFIKALYNIGQDKKKEGASFG